VLPNERVNLDGHGGIEVGDDAPDLIQIAPGSEKVEQDRRRPSSRRGFRDKRFRDQGYQYGIVGHAASTKVARGLFRELAR
jgi:hypothetical protein